MPGPAPFRKRPRDTCGPGMPGPYRALINCVIVMILRILLKISSVYGKIRR